MALDAEHAAPASISRRAYESMTQAFSWEEIFEAGPYYERLSELLEDAEHYAVFVGWQIDSRLPLRRPFRPRLSAIDDAVPGEAERTRVIESLKEKILRLVESKPHLQFYFLMWDHAYFYVLERETWQGRIWDGIHPRIHFLFDNRHPFGGSHHEKICIIDGKTAFCGGIDLCDERWDTPQHLYSDPRRSLDWHSEHHGPYHDIAVQVTGPVCADMQRHVQKRWRALSCVPFPDPRSFPPAAEEAAHRVYLSRTMAPIGPTSRLPVIREIEFLFRDLIHSAERRIILEGQYYWSAEVNDMLVSKIHQMAGRDFEIVLVLADLRCLKALTSQLSLYELALLEKLETAARSAGVRLTLGFPHVHPPAWEATRLEDRSKPIYIHSKIMLIDDRYLSIGSANLASRALRLDTEINLTFEARNEAERAHIRRFADSILKHWNLGAEKVADSDVHLHLIDAAEQVRRRTEEMAPLFRLFHRVVPWKFFFDPQVPWFHPIERRFRILAKARFPWVVLVTAILWAGSSFAALLLAGTFAPVPLDRWEVFYAFVLTSVWFAPVPFTPVAVLSIFQLGFDRGMSLSICSLWVAVLLGYWLTRGFPTYLTAYYRTSGPAWLPRRLLLRQFPATVAVSLDPRVMLRSKIAFQGLYCVPIPWFALNMLLVLPSALYFLLFILHQTMREPATSWIQSAAPKILLALSAYSVTRLAGSLLLKGRFGEKKTP